MTLVAVSRDDTSDSRSFARDYGIDYPLISDRDGSISRALVGIDTNDHSIPGVVVIRRDGAIAFRQIASSKDDRLTARELLEAIDRSLGTAGELVDNMQPAFYRAQLRGEVGGARIRVGGQWDTTLITQVSISVPLNRYLIAGTGLATSDTTASLRGSLGVRLPLVADIAALQLSAETGLPITAPGIYAGIRGGLWYAHTPRWAFNLEAAIGVYDAGAGDQQPGWATTFGVARLLGR